MLELSFDFTSSFIKTVDIIHESHYARIPGTCLFMQYRVATEQRYKFYIRFPQIPI